MAFTELDARRLGRVRRYFARHPGASDVLVCLFFALGAVDLVSTALGGVLGIDPDPSARGVAGTLVLAALGTVALAFRRRSPVQVAVLLAVLGAGAVLLSGHLGPFALGFAFALYVVAATLPQRVGWIVLGSASVLVIGALLAWGEDASGGTGMVTVTTPDGTVVQRADGEDAAAASDVPSFLLLGLVGMAVGANVRGRRLHTRGLVERHQQLMDASEQQAKLAAAAEQTRIAREMHDVVAHGLTVMIALSDGARAAVRRSPDDAETALDLLSETGRSALADMRRMLGVLRGADVPLEPQPGTQDLESLVQQFRAAGLTVHLTTTGPPLPSDAGLSLTVYRVVQESLTNALRHAGAGSRVDVLVRHGDRRVGIEVVDDGGGAAPVGDGDGDGGRLSRLGDRLSDRRSDLLDARTDAEPASALPTAPVPARTGRGLVGMRERAAVYRGTVSAGPYRAGWRVHVELRTDDTGATATVVPGTPPARPTTTEEHA
ncbi:sensor histidine kinase [Cellulomonas hominis]|uniref:sensor histidine kinase n=1 Tax=Cellulomonas hominis TaxID=156981 RepID=UPI001B94F82C|nr:histidine kinase [Cellulomonas hominis]VTR77646.1 Sensor histidine kinase DesK [Cellulomonas hominis]